MQVTKADVPDVLMLDPDVFFDARGFFFESFNAREFEEKAGLSPRFVQDNISGSVRGAVRGLHYQLRRTQGKLVRAISGEVYDVAVDLRKRSPTFGRWAATKLSAENKRMVWIPPGFAHGFLTLSAHAEVLYKMTDYWAPEDERILLWSEPQLNIPWPLSGTPVISEKDRAGKLLKDADLFE
jgi:dTDP-4-dehydrorhamnose 3,5-epimerase